MPCVSYISLAGKKENRVRFLTLDLISAFVLSWVRLCNCSSPSSSVHGILQARILEGVSIFLTRISCQLRDWTLVSCLAGRFLTVLSYNKCNREVLLLLVHASIFFSGVFFCLHHAACKILVPWSRIQPGPLAEKVTSPNHWTAWEFPMFCEKVFF